MLWPNAYTPRVSEKVLCPWPYWPYSKCPKNEVSRSIHTDTLFHSCDLDFDPITLTYKHDLELDTQTDVTECITTPHLPVATT